MIYNILNIADIHFGAVKPDRLLYELELIDKLIEGMHSLLHMVVICGDYWDSKLGLYSKSSIKGIQWMNRLARSCDKYGIVLIVFRGTYSHDDDQLEAFRDLEKSYRHFHIYTENTVVDIFPDLRIMIAPDETISTEEYLEKYADNYLGDKEIDIGFFHGNFDYVAKSFLTQDSEINGINTLIFEFEFWNNLIKGPLIAGHWHSYQNHKDSAYYVSSFSRWCYNEEDDKGALLLSYDTETSGYYIQRVINKRAMEYNTTTMITSFFSTTESCTRLIHEVKTSLDEYEARNIRIKIIIDDDKKENDVFIDMIKDAFVNNKRVKILIVNKYEKQLELAETEKKNEELSKFSFTMDDGMNIADKIHLFILEKYGEDIPLERIQASVDKYTKE